MEATVETADPLQRALAKVGAVKSETSEYSAMLFAEAKRLAGATPAERARWHEYQERNRWREWMRSPAPAAAR